MALGEPKRSSKRGLILGIDLGGTKILSAVVNPYNTIVSRFERPTPVASSERVLTDAIIGCSEDALRAANVTDKDIIAIGMGAPGPLNPETGVIIRTRSIALKNYAIGQILAKHFGVPVTLGNHAHMRVYGEFRAGAALGCRNVVGLWIGTGIGGCVIRDWEVVLGANRNAGEIGRMILDLKLHANDRRRGTLEAEASKLGMHSFIRRALKKGEKTRLKKYGTARRLKISDLAKAFEKGDEVAVSAVRHSARFCGIGIANLFNVLSPEVFILGGSIIENFGEDYVRMAKKIADKYAYTMDLAPIRIVTAQLGEDCGTLGAAIAARDRM